MTSTPAPSRAGTATARTARTPHRLRADRPRGVLLRERDWPVQTRTSRRDKIGVARFAAGAAGSRGLASTRSRRCLAAIFGIEGRRGGAHGS